MKINLRMIPLFIPIATALWIFVCFSIFFIDGFFWTFQGDAIGFGDWFENERGFAKTAYISAFISILIALFLSVRVKQ